MHEDCFILAELCQISAKLDAFELPDSLLYLKKKKKVFMAKIKPRN